MLLGPRRSNICNKPYMTIKLTKASGMYLEPSETSMMEFLAKTLNGFCKKAP